MDNKKVFMYGIVAGITGYHVLRNTKLSVDVLGLRPITNNIPQLPLPTEGSSSTNSTNVTLALAGLAAFMFLKK